jgi:exodeoxyribonuclease VII large subunit
MNKEIEFPIVPQRIAVISSGSAAGYSDFINHLKENNHGYVFYAALFETVMQGIETEQSVISALDWIAGFPDLFDVVVIIRGGGSQIDLSWFDSYNIAYHVTQFPLPVITGIGHEKDFSVTDMVAFQSLKTPTAVADFLIERTEGAEINLNDMSSDIIEHSLAIIEENRTRLETFRINLIPVARLMISRQKEKLSKRIIELINTGKELILRSGVIPANQKSKLISSAGSFIPGKSSVIERMRMDLISSVLNILGKIKVRADSVENTLNILNPENVLKRGFTITTMNGKIIKSSKQINREDIIETHFSDGGVKSKVMERQK